MLTDTMTEYFILFDNEYYKQHDRVAKGPTFVNIFLCAHEFLWIEKCPPEFRPLTNKRCVYDTFLLFENIYKIEKLKCYLNIQQTKI